MLHWQRFVHDKLLDLQEHRNVEQSALHWHLNDGLGGWENLSCDWFHLISRCVLVESMLQRIQELLLGHACLTPYCGLDLDSVDMLLESTKGGRQLVTCSHMLAEKMPSRLRNAHNLDAIWCVCSTDECSQR